MFFGEIDEKLPAFDASRWIEYCVRAIDHSRTKAKSPQTMAKEKMSAA